MTQDYSAEFINEMREELESRRADLVNRSRIARTDMRKRDMTPGDSIDESTDEQGTSTEMHLKDRERNLLAQINEALGRITDGDYGYCEECGEPIGEGRLRVRPMTTLCIDDKEEQERKQRRHHTKGNGMFSPTNKM